MTANLSDFNKGDEVIVTNVYPLELIVGQRGVVTAIKPPFVVALVGETPYTFFYPSELQQIQPSATLDDLI